MTIKYVKDFEFPAKAGYTKSAARKPAKMAAGGRVTDAELRVSDAELRAAQKAMGASGRVTDAELRALKRAMGASKPESITIREVTETIGRPDRRTDGERKRRLTDREQRERMGSSITLEEIEAMAIADALRDQEEQNYLQELIVEELIGDRVEGAARLTDAEIRALERLTDAELRALDDNERVDFNEGGSLPKIWDYEMYQPGGSQGPDSTDKRRMLAAERERMAAAQASSPAYNHDRWAETRARNFDDFLSHPANRRKPEGMMAGAQRGLGEDRGYMDARMAAAQRGSGADRGQRRLDQLAQRGAAGMPQRQYDQLGTLPEQPDPGGYDAGGYDSNSYDNYEDEGYAKGGPNWIKGAIKKPGALRKTLKVKKGESIPKGELKKAAKGEKIDGKKPSKKTQQRARLAETLGKMNTKKAAKGGSMRKQGYDDQLDESLGSRNGSNSQPMKSRRNESKGMEKSMGKRAYSAVDTMDMAKGGSTNKLAAVNRSTALKGFKQMGVMKRG